MNKLSNSIDFIKRLKKFYLKKKIRNRAYYRLD